jgi:hypothetical protein
MHAQEQTQHPLRMPCGVTDSSQERWMLLIGLVQRGCGFWARWHLGLLPPV